MQRRSDAKPTTAKPEEDEDAFMKDAEQKGEKVAERKERDAARANGGVGPGVFPSGDEGEVVHLGSNALFAPKQFNNFSVGPFHLETKVRPGETRCDAYRRLAMQLGQMEKEEFDRKLAFFRKAHGIMVEGQR